MSLHEDLLLAVAARLDAEGQTFRRLLGQPEGRNATVDACAHCASIVRQVAFEVSTRGAEAVIRRTPPAPSTPSFTDAVHAAAAARLSAIYGRSAREAEIQHEMKAMRRALCAAWPHLHASAKRGDDA
jgi:hypothetical protein